MSFLSEVEKVSHIYADQSPNVEAWLYHFSIENNIEYLLNPSIVASPEQLRFMVALKGEQFYAPCDDELFFDISHGNKERIHEEYNDCWLFIENLVNSYDLSDLERKRLLSFCSYRYQTALDQMTVLPSRLSKRLVGTVISQCGQSDPFLERKKRANAQAAEFLEDESIQEALYSLPAGMETGKNIPEVQENLALLELKRLMGLGTTTKLYRGKSSKEGALASLKDAGEDISVLQTAFGRPGPESRKILMISARAGWCIFDIAMARTLVRQGHQVMLVLKDAFYFNAPVITDIGHDSTLSDHLKDAHIIENTAITKNELIRLLREHRFVVMSDGTSEQLNFYRTSVTFARAWKECDLVISAGRRQKAVLMGTSHEFTRDILCFSRDQTGKFSVEFKPRADWVIKFAEKDLIAKANELIAEMQAAKRQGNKVMFYSAIIGSIPGQTETAIKLVNSFVGDLRNMLDKTFIINPAEHFVEGMDGDDLMFMWERVQRSGLLDVWRFQTSEDIEKSFSLLGERLPVSWLGKDSTFSTGCTKEMYIALDVQKKHPEMQIIGPRPELFFRRRDYGVGKYYDATIEG